MRPLLLLALTLMCAALAAPGAAARVPLTVTAPTPDPLAARQAWTIRVDQPGIQSISAADLSAATPSPARLHLWRAGIPVPTELVYDTGGALSELRFYAPPPGDRYNSADTYWLTAEATAGPAMTSLDARPTGAPCQGTALARGTWRLSALYDSRLPGPDGDHYFAAELKVVNALRDTDTVTVTVNPDLPLATGPLTLTIAGASIFTATHTLSVTLAGTVRPTSWFGTNTEVFSRSLSFPSAAGQAAIALMPDAKSSAETDSIHLDSVSWEAPVSLSFGGRGAAFVGESGLRCYGLSGLPAGAALYDVTDPAAPVRLLIGTASFEVSAAAVRSYVIAGPGTLHTPVVSAHTPVDLTQPLNAQAIYIAPDAFVSALEPLVDQRRSQGYSVAVVPAAAIYDTWGGGQVSPQAIRSFLRYAAATWSVKPIAVTLVGDGTSDPRNYLGIGQASWIPPYLAMVDPWFGETACESCFVQLDGDGPLDRPGDAMPDLMLGRLPVKSAAELGQLAQKIIAYERSNDIGVWRGRAVYLADNQDAAGDFAYVQDQSIGQLPPAVAATRVYYDPDPPAGEPWRTRDPLLAFQRTMDAFNSGAATVSYMGHGQLYQWAYTGPPLDPSAPQDQRFLMGVDFAGDLTNGTRLPIVLSLTCLTGAFQVPSVRGTTVDEALLLNPHGGAIATWSSSGLGVLYGHDALEHGFLSALWSAPPGSPPTLGALAMAGYQELFTTRRDCCLDSLRTYGLLGDPLTPARVQTGVREVVLPLVQR
ncbi:MAG: C25 family cysteine peptidase [Chloroflexales bacterium]